MALAKVSPKYQIVIPKAVREQTSLEVGQTVQVIPYKDRLELIPLVELKQRRGFLAGIDTTIEREGDRV